MRHSSMRLLSLVCLLMTVYADEYTDLKVEVKEVDSKKYMVCGDHYFDYNDTWYTWHRDEPHCCYSDDNKKAVCSRVKLWLIILIPSLAGTLCLSSISSSVGLSICASKKR